MTQAFDKALEYIESIPKFVKKNTMQDTKAFYRKLSCPCKDAKVIHVAGTNGKGSVCAYLQSVFMEAGYSVGLFISPHLIDIRERIRIDRDRISKEDFVQAFTCVKECCGLREAEKQEEEAPQAGYHPSYFEYLYFMAMLYFEKKRPDLIILETGLGGRLDATNSFPSPCISIITRIGLDHTEYLGETLEEIAAEKAGIVKKGIPLVYFAKNKIISDVIEKSVKKADSGAFSVKPAEIRFQNCDEKGIDFSYYSGYYKYSTFHLSTRALYQQENAALCIRALAVLDGRGIVKVSGEDLRKGLERTRWEGRMEEILQDVYVDGAHNVDGVDAFLKSVRADGAAGGRMLLYSALADKACDQMAEKIAGSGLFEEIVVTRIENPRAAEAKELAGSFSKNRVTVLEDVEEALGYCLRKKPAGGKVYITGSLYLVGRVKDLAEKKESQTA